MRTSLIIPTKNGAFSLSNCLEIVSRQKIDGPEVEIVIVDSGSGDNTAEIAREFNAVVESIAALSFSHGGARNLGATRSHGDILVFLNQDVAPIGTTWLRNLTSPLEDGFSATYSRQLAPPGTPYHEMMFLSHFYSEREQTHTIHTLREQGIGGRVLFSTVSGAMRRDTWRSLRFNEQIIMSEDQEFACRLLLAGHQIRYEPTSMVYHANRYSAIGAFRRYFDSGWSFTSFPKFGTANYGRSARFVLDLAGKIIRDDQASRHDKGLGLSFLAWKIAGFGLGQLAPYMPDQLRARISYTQSVVADLSR